MQQQSSPLGQGKNNNPSDVFSSKKGLSFFQGISSVTLNNTIYIYGNDEKNAITSIRFISSKDVHNNKPPSTIKSTAPSLQHNTTSSNNIRSEEPVLLYSPGIPLDGTDEILVFASLRLTNNATLSSVNTTNMTDPTTSTNPQLMQVFKFGLKSEYTWSLIPEKSAGELMPIHRQEHSISLSLPHKDNVYLFGGTNDNSLAQNDFWIYSLKDFQWRQLVLPAAVETRCGHTSTMLNNGKLVIIGGYACKQQLQESHPPQLIALDKILVYDTKNATWMDQPKVNGLIPSPRVHHSAILSSQNETRLLYTTYLGSQSDRLEDMAAILDTNSWSWRTPKPSPLYQPYPQSHGIISIMNETKIVYGLGVNYHTLFDSLHTFDVINEIWEPSDGSVIRQDGYIEPSYNNGSKINHVIMWIILACIGFALVFLYVIALWIFGFKKVNIMFYNLLQIVKREVWKPRIGEPGWAETSRLFLKSLFFFLFLYLIFTLTTQVLNSPTIDQISYEKNAYSTVDIPDVKFCFEHVPENDEIFIRCVTDFGSQCSDYFVALPTLDSPDSAHEVCFLFRAPSSFKIGPASARLKSKGSLLKFDYYRNSLSSDNITQVRVELYNKLQDSNLAIYGLLQESNTTDIDSTSELNEHNVWNERLKTGSTYHVSKSSYELNTNVMSTISYELIKHISLKTEAWNYLGISPSVNVQYEIETLVYSESFVTEYMSSPGSNSPFGSLHVYPLYDQTKVLREQKAFAFINAVGVLGGLFGLLFSLQSCLFGYRPRSPWGYMHRWSFGLLRSSLMNGLHTNFFPARTKTLENGKTSINTYVRELPSAQFNDTIRSQMSGYVLSEHNNIYAGSYHSSCSSIPQQPNVPIMVQASSTANKLHPLAIPSKDDATYLLPLSPTINMPSIEGKKSNELRMTLIEERIHMLERLFQAYYIDDEIFRSLDRAVQADISTSPPSSNTFSGDSTLEHRFGRKKKYKS